MTNTNQKTKRYSVKAIENKFNVFVERIDKYEDHFKVSNPNHKWKVLSISQADYVLGTGNTLADIWSKLEADEAYKKALLDADKTEYDYGYEYAETDMFDGPVDIEGAVGGSVEIPVSDYEYMVQKGIKNPDAREYWRGFNDYFSK